MSKVIPASRPNIEIGNFVIQRDIRAEDFQALIEAQNLDFASRGSHVPGMWPTHHQNSFKTSSSSFTQSNSSGAYHWDMWNPCFSAQREIWDAGSSVLFLRLDYHCVAKNIEVKIHIDGWDGEVLTTDVEVITVSTSTGNFAELMGSATFTVAESNASGGEPRTLSAWAEAKSLGLDAEVMLDYMTEYRLEVGDTSKLP